MSSSNAFLNADNVHKLVAKPLKGTAHQHQYKQISQGQAWNSTKFATRKYHRFNVYEAQYVHPDKELPTTDLDSPLKPIDFYRVTLCVTPVFAVVRPSVRLSRWCRPIVSRRLKISSNFFLGPVAKSFVFFRFGAPIPNSKGNLVSGRGAKYTGGVGKFCDFRLKSPFISETVRDRAMER